MAGSNPGHFCYGVIVSRSRPVNAGTTREGNAAAYSPRFFLRWPSVRSRKALSLMKRAVSRWS
jgi:hypothetical protein